MYSKDSQFDLTYLETIGKNQLSELHPHISKFRIKDKNINLLYGGNAVNFVHGAVNGPYIYSVQAGLIIGAIKLINQEIEYNVKQIQELKISDMEEISRIWLKNFDNYAPETNFRINNPSFIKRLKSQGDNVKAFVYLEFAVELHYRQEKEYRDLAQLLYYMADKLSQGGNDFNILKTVLLNADFTPFDFLG